HMPARMDKRYHAVDLLSDILGGGASSRLHQTLVKEKKLFSNIDCHHSGSTDAGLLTIEGKLVKGVKIQDAEKAVDEILRQLQQEPVMEIELQKVKNKTESMMAFEDMSVMNRANSLAYYELLGDAEMMNTELGLYAAVTSEEIREESKAIFKEENSNTLYYLSEN
ncbi:MAG: insulinase family protein, partial [Sphingobacteriales bacterium]